MSLTGGRVQLDLTSYPMLADLYENHPKKFAEILKGFMIYANDATAKGWLETSKEVYGMEFLELMETVMDTFLDVEGIVEQHHNDAEKAGLKGMSHDIHPLAIFTNNAVVYNTDGENVSPSEWIGQDNFNLKNWLYALFYGARFVSWKELAKYLNLGKFDLIDVLKARNFPELAKIQPALHYQEQQGITKGKLIEGMGLFDGGHLPKDLEQCPACESENWSRTKKYMYCPECKIGGEM